MTIIYNGTGGGIPRKTAKIFAENAASIDVTEFGSTLAGDPTPASDIDDIQNEAFQTGWRDAVISNLNYPLMGDMNAVQKTATQQIAYTLQHGVPEWDSATEYYAYDIVAKNAILYVSIVDENTNHDVTDGDYWAVYYDPNDTKAKRNIGELIFSLLPLASTDLHLCDGTLLSNNGIYIEFCQHIASLYTSGDYDNLFCTESEWQTSISTYGACGKFVYDSVNSTVRLPRLTGMVEGTLDVTALTDLTSAGLPSFTHTHTYSGTTEDANTNHTHSGSTGYMNQNASHAHGYTAHRFSPIGATGGGTGNLTTEGDYTTSPADINHYHDFTTGYMSANHQHGYSGTTANNSSVSGIYGNSATVQPQTIKGFYYIVVSNTVATDYTIQWDDVAADLAMKVDKAGDTMTGDLGISKSTPPVFYGLNPNLDKTSTTTPTNDIYGVVLQANDVNNASVGSFMIVHTAGSNAFVAASSVERIVSGVNKLAQFGIGIDSTGQDFAYATNGVKQSITNWSFPSSRYDNLALGASGTQYTAPADGYVYVGGTQYALSGYIFLSNDANGMQVVSQPTNVSSFEVRCIMPLAKGQQYTIIYGDLYINVFRFVYAIGEA